MLCHVLPTLGLFAPTRSFQAYIRIWKAYIVTEVYICVRTKSMEIVIQTYVFPRMERMLNGCLVAIILYIQVLVDLRQVEYSPVPCATLRLSAVNVADPVS